jgi:hypothetical protein
MAGAIVPRRHGAEALRGNNVEKATVAILAGLEVGLTPLVAALQSIAVINNTPADFLWRRLGGAGARVSGLLEDIQDEGSTSTRRASRMLAMVQGQAQGRGNVGRAYVQHAVDVRCAPAGRQARPVDADAGRE